MDNLDIFITTYKDFKEIVHNDSYKVIDNRKIGKYLGLDDKFYSEILAYFHIAENYDLKKYVGSCHYRRYFEFMDDVPNLDKTFDTASIIVPKPSVFRKTIREQYASCHNIEDLDIICDIVRKKYPSYTESLDKFINGRVMFPYNMFIMKSEEFLEYIKFIKDILTEYISIVGNDINKRIEENKDKYLKKFYPNSTIEYQYRIGGYLAERLTSVWIIQHHKKVIMEQVIITEDKYGRKQKSETLK